MELAKSWEPGHLPEDAKKLTCSYLMRISEKNELEHFFGNKQTHKKWGLCKLILTAIRQQS